jgi:hypothetical protein
VLKGTEQRFQASPNVKRNRKRKMKKKPQKLPENCAKVRTAVLARKSKNAGSDAGVT